MKPQHKIFAQAVRDMRAKKPGCPDKPYKCYQYAFPTCKSVRAAQVGASRLMKRTDVREFIDRVDQMVVQAEINHKLVHRERILDEEAKLGFHNVVNMLDENGQMRDLKDMPPEVQAAISDIEYGFDPATNSRYLKKIKFYNKGQALDRMEKVLGMQREKLEVDLIADIRAMIVEIDGKGKGVLPQEAG